MKENDKKEINICNLLHRIKRITGSVSGCIMIYKEEMIGEGHL